MLELHGSNPPRSEDYGPEVNAVASERLDFIVLL